MGVLFSQCVENKHRGEDFRKITGVVPNQVCEVNQNASIDQIERFYFIPHEQQINKAIEHLEELPILSDKDTLLLNEMITELTAHRRKLGPYVPTRQTLVFSGPQSPAVDNKEYNRKSDIVETKDIEKEPKEVRTMTISAPIRIRSSLQGVGSIGKSIKPNPKPTLMVEARCAKFLHEEILQKHGLQRPYVVIKIYVRPEGRQDVVTIEGFKQIQTFTTHQSEETIDPRWTAFYDHEFDFKTEEKEKFSLYSVGVALFYRAGEKNEAWQVGEEQHFSLSSLADQRMQTKVIDFKDTVMKGILARVKIVFQLLHNAEEIKENLKKDIEIGIERLIKVSEKHSVPNNMKFSTSLLTGIDNGQSVISAYSFTGMKEVDYYIET